MLFLYWFLLLLRVARGAWRASRCQQPGPEGGGGGPAAATAPAPGAGSHDSSSPKSPSLGDAVNVRENDDVRLKPTAPLDCGATCSLRGVVDKNAPGVLVRGRRDGDNSGDGKIGAVTTAGAPVVPAWDAGPLLLAPPLMLLAPAPAPPQLPLPLKPPPTTTSSGRDTTCASTAGRRSDGDAETSSVTLEPPRDRDMNDRSEPASRSFWRRAASSRTDDARDRSSSSCWCSTKFSSFSEASCPCRASLRSLTGGWEKPCTTNQKLQTTQ